MVTVRGPGNGIVGYCFLTATTSNFTTTGPWPSTLPGQLQGTLTAIPPGTTPKQAQALLEPSKRTVRIEIIPAPDPQVTIDIDFQGGQGFQRVLQFAAPQPVPASYRFGFAASTGLFTDVHLIRNLTVSTLTPLPGNNRSALQRRHQVHAAARTSMQMQSCSVPVISRRHMTRVKRRSVPESQKGARFIIGCAEVRARWFNGHS
jgi:hypothetical protein